MGKTTAMESSQNKAKKHPHAHGEDRLKKLIEESEEETPPRAWGRRTNHLLEVTKSRNTPTRMGKTQLKTVIKYIYKKHPHAHGEDQ